jgi:acyl carrier protein
MDRTEIAERANAIMVKEFELDAAMLSPGAKLYEELDLDSLDSVDLVAALEREFGVTIDRQRDEKVLRSMRTLQDVYDFIAAKFPA